MSEQDWFLWLQDPWQAIAAWRRDDNDARPHSDLRRLAPGEFAEAGRNFEPDGMTDFSLPLVRHMGTGQPRSQPLKRWINFPGHSTGTAETSPQTPSVHRTPERNDDRSDTGNPSPSLPVCQSKSSQDHRHFLSGNFEHSESQFQGISA